MNNRLKPHKAENADLSKLRFPAYCFPKVDGVRGCFLGSQFTGRSMKPFRNSHIGKKFSDPLLAGFDGELVHGTLTDQDLCRKTTSLVGSYPFNTQGELPDWYIFDYVTPATAHLPYQVRWEIAKDTIAVIQQTRRDLAFIKPMPGAVLVNSLEEVETWHQHNVSLGFEGTIIRWLEAPHKNGKCTVRESYYMRIKDFSYEEGIVTGYTEAQVNDNELTYNALGLAERSSHKANKYGKGCIGSLEITRDSGEVVTVGPGKLTQEERYHYFDNPTKLLGNLATFKFMPYGMKDQPRFATFENFRLLEDL